MLLLAAQSAGYQLNNILYYFTIKTLGLMVNPMRENDSRGSGAPETGLKSLR